MPALFFYRDMRRMFGILYLIIGLIIGYFIGGSIFISGDPDVFEVTDKYEQDGKCFIQLWIEVDPMDYIGLDIGDEFNLE